MSVTTEQEVLDKFRSLPVDAQNRVADEIDRMTIERRWQSRWREAEARLRGLPELSTEEIVQEVKAIRRERHSHGAN